MKLLPLIKQIISEVGEGTAKPYEFSTIYDESSESGDSGQRRVTFETEDGDKYKVALGAYWGDNYIVEKYGAHLTIDFFLTGKSDFLDADTVVNKGRLFRVMATIVKITKEYLDDIGYKEKGINQLRISPTKTRSDEDDRRANLYMAYIKRQLPVASIEYDGDEIVAKIK